MSFSVPAVQFTPVVLSDTETVAAIAPLSERVDTAYQTERQLEDKFIEQLIAQGYEYLPIHSQKALIGNLRTQLEVLNGYEFSEAEWDRYYHAVIANDNADIEDKARWIHETNTYQLELDSGEHRNIDLLDKRNLHNNKLQVINQYVTEAKEPGTRRNRYDVTILVNGLPLVHIELKRRGVRIREAFNQIERYGRESFWGDNALFDFVQLFVISNGTDTKYYSNTTRLDQVNHARDRISHIERPRRQIQGFEYTNWWTDADNTPIKDLESFTRTFFAQHTLLNILIRYCVFTEDKLVLVMRPYQIVAAERILRRIVIATNNKQVGTVAAGGYIWHTTGSGKTLTSFKTAQLAVGLQDTSGQHIVDKVLFVVDRRDLDYQTMLEYDNFQRGAANSNTSTRILTRQLGDPNARIIVTTIQKLTNFVEANREHPVYRKHVALIFDECHRSQFGKMRRSIVKRFRNYHLFGFTGTPIFEANAPTPLGGYPVTTAQAFGDQLHAYTIVNGIEDKNVLPFHVEYHEAQLVRNDTPTDESKPRELDPAKIEATVGYILDHFRVKTRRANEPYTDRAVDYLDDPAPADSSRRNYSLNRKRGFNAILATSGIPHARAYYNAFERLQDALGIAKDKRLRVGLIYSYAANPESVDGISEEETSNTDKLDQSSKEFLEDAIADYNDMFGTSYDTSSQKFEGYYKDLQKRIKERDLDLTIVVDMLLTGFDARTLNTLFVDKSLRMHGLIQAFSRTNRILNSVKVHGNIVCFRDLEEAVDEALQLFGDKNAKAMVLLPEFSELYEEYAEAVEVLREYFPAGERVVGYNAKVAFAKRFGRILRLHNMLQSFDEFTYKAKLTDREVQDYNSEYLTAKDDLESKKRGRLALPAGSEVEEDLAEQLEFEIELVKQIDIDVDYILELIAKFKESKDQDEADSRRTDVFRAVDANPATRLIRDLFDEFLQRVHDVAPDQIPQQWLEFVNQKAESEVKALIARENLNPTQTRKLASKALAIKTLRRDGTALASALPPISRFGGGREEKKMRVADALELFVERFAPQGVQINTDTDQ